VLKILTLPLNCHEIGVLVFKSCSFGQQTRTCVYVIVNAQAVLLIDLAIVF